jgi:hypothetical protein
MNYERGFADTNDRRSEFVRLAVLLKLIEAEFSGASQIFAPWKRSQSGQYTSSHVLDTRQKLTGSVSIPVDTGRPVIGHSNRIVPMSFSCSMNISLALIVSR